MANGRFELKASTQETQNSVTEEGYLECITVDISGFDGVKGGTYAKKGEETSHRNPKAGHMQKKAREHPTEIQKRDIIRKKICICPNKRKMWDIVKRKSAYVPTKGKCGT